MVVHKSVFKDIKTSSVSCRCDNHVISSQDNSTSVGIQVERDEGYPNVKSQDVCDIDESEQVVSG